MNRLFSLLIFIFFISSFFVSPLWADSSSINQQIQGENQEIQRLKNEKKNTLALIQKQKKQEWGILEKIRALKKDIRKTRIRLNTLTQQIRGLKSKISKTQKEITRLNETIRRDRIKVAQQLETLYKFNQFKKLTHLPGQRKFGNYLRNKQLIRRLTTLDAQTLKRLQRNAGQYQQQKHSLDSRLSEIKSLEAEEADKNELLLFEQRQQLSYLKHIREDKTAKLRYLGEIQAEVEKLNNIIFSLEQQKKAIRKKGTQLTGFRGKKGKIHLPVEGTLVRKFGENDIDGFSLYKRGILVRTPENASAESFLDGKVVFSGPFRGFGLLIIVDHGKGSFSVYGNLDKLFVQLGDFVSKGKVIGRVAQNPIENDYLFYFETRYNGISTNPYRWISTNSWSNSVKSSKT